MRHESHVRSRSLSGLGAWLGLVVLAALWIAVSGPTQAKVQPYYVVTGIGVASIKPRVLFVVDTSGSMAWKSQKTDAECVWNECEGTGGASQSRISTARRAIRQVVNSMSTTASFALMTFDQNRAPTTAVPRKCAAGTRFQWVTKYKYFSTWLNISQYTGYTGTWRLCDDTSRPYPYLRWDELGVGPVVTANNQTGTIPASPLISTASASRQAASNGTRRVQWFPKFMGVRTQLNNTTDPDGSILAATIGDWAADSATRASNVKNHDFYYWPYVDGFPGYANFTASPADGTYGNLSLGIAEETGASKAMLYAPFYIDLSSSSVPAASRGPATDDLARATVLDTVAPMISGGIDADGGTPWASVIGATTVTPPSSNAPYSHTTVTSYLKFVINNGNVDACAPTTAVLVTDGLPSPSSEGGATLYTRLAALRKTLGVRTYVVGFFLDNAELHSMACAAAGACTGTCTAPCTNTPTAAWDTCADSANPASGCAYLAGSADSLATVLTRIISEAVKLDVEAGPGERLAEFGVGASGTPGEGHVVQTTVRARTEWPAWRGHVERKLCTDPDPSDPTKTAPWCQNQPFELDELEETFGPCTQSRTWDAGECLRQTSWKTRRLYTHTAAHALVPINDTSTGKATAQFKAELVALGLMTGLEADAGADTLVAFLLGRDFPASWKLPGLANSAPVVVRRIPRVQSGYTPSVPIRDPHCSGRQLSEVDISGLPNSLENFAREAWSADGIESAPSPHRRYQEAVMVGDDLGVLHAFQLDSGNELFGFIPRFLLANAIAESKIGGASFGQPSLLADHKYGIAATLNQGWVYDEAAKKWRHLGVFGLGAGGTELVALDLSHMSPSADEGPIEVLWTTEDPTLKADYDKYAGETWARPALSYIVPGNNLGAVPTARLVFGSGYARAGQPTEAGRTLMYSDAVTGKLLEHAVLPVAPTSFEPAFGSLVDPALGSHCISRYWGELQEAYFADPAGRLFRWDLGNAHAADGGGTWNGTATPSLSFGACEGSGTTCTVGSAHGDPFLFAPAVTAGGRIDVPGGAATGDVPLGVDQFLVALASGAPAEQTIGTSVSNFHSSLYLLVDDHSSSPHNGFDVPSGAPKVDPSALQASAHYARIAVTDLTRTRKFKPFATAPSYEQTGKFSRGTRPIRSPRIEVAGVVDKDSLKNGGTPEVISGVEIYTITYTLYEPPSGKCDVRFFDSAKNIWYADEGSTYEVKLRVTAIAGAGFDFSKGADDDVAKFDSGFAPGLVLQSVTQTAAGGCSDGNCGPMLDPPAMRACDNNVEGPSGGGGEGFAISSTNAELAGFTPME